MNNEEKKLLIKDLLARLPYGVKFLRESWNYEWDQELSVVETLEDIDKDGYINNTKVYNVCDIKPFLRSMSSMTEEEKKEFEDICTDIAKDRIHFVMEGSIDSNYMLEKFDWLNKNHFDYRGLIERGLAIEVTTENNPYEQNKS